jgi:hypothetical protein
VLRACALGPGHWTDEPLTGTEREGVVVKVVENRAGNGQRLGGGATARVAWDSGTTGRHSLGLVRVLDDKEGTA